MFWITICSMFQYFSAMFCYWTCSECSDFRLLSCSVLNNYITICIVFECSGITLQCSVHTMYCSVPVLPCSVQVIFWYYSAGLLSRFPVVFVVFAVLSSCIGCFMALRWLAAGRICYILVLVDTVSLFHLHLTWSNLPLLQLVKLFLQCSPPIL